MLRLLELRTELSLSQKQMAEKFKVSQGTYNNWEKGNTQPSIEQIIQLASYFRVSINYLVMADDMDEFDYSHQSIEEREAILMFRKLNDNNKALVKELIKALYGKNL